MYDSDYAWLSTKLLSQKEREKVRVRERELKVKREGGREWERTQDIG